jgi:hypothetical protein
MKTKTYLKNQLLLTRRIDYNIMIQYVLNRLHLPVLSILILTYFEFLCRESAAGNTMRWIFGSPFQYILNLLLVFALLLFFAALTGRTSFGYMVLSVLRRNIE